MVSYFIMDDWLHIVYSGTIRLPVLKYYGHYHEDLGSPIIIGAFI